MQTRFVSGTALSAATTVPLGTFDTTGIEQLSIKAVTIPDAGTFAAGDAQLFVRAVSDAGGDDVLIPPVRTNNDAPLGTRAGVLAQYDVRGFKVVRISLRNNHATQSGTGNVDLFYSPRNQDR